MKPVTSASLPHAASTREQANEAAGMIRAGNYGVALQYLQDLLAREPQNLAAWCLAAQAHANAGQLGEAEAACLRALAVSSFAPLPYLVMARLAAERGEQETSKNLLKKVIYLNPHSIRSYLDLVVLYEIEGDKKRVEQTKRNALAVLAGLSDESSVPDDEFAIEEKMMVGELRRHLQNSIE